MKRHKEREPIPFYFLNDTFNAEEIKIQLDFMRDTGVGAFFLHVRDGILDEAYGTETYFKRVKFIVEQAAERKIKVWLYDEDSFPSGNAGGQIAIEHPELQAYSLKVVKLKAEEIKDGTAKRVLGRVRGLFGYAVKNENGVETSRKITDCFGVVRRYWYRRDMNKTYYCDMQDKLFFPHIRAGTCYSEIIFEAEAGDGEEIYVAYLEPVITACRRIASTGVQPKNSSRARTKSTRNTSANISERLFPVYLWTSRPRADFCLIPTRSLPSSRKYGVTT